MRNRTEMVTTTFYDSQDDDSDTDDSEEDWRPSSGRSQHGRKRTHSNSGGKSRKLKRKLNSKSFKSNISSSAEETSDDDYYSRSDGESHTNTKHLLPDYKSKGNEKNIPDRNGIFQLYVYRSDLRSDYRENMELCLWRWDGDLLIQKYIRLKSEPNEFVFTPSAVYSNWVSNRRKDFETIEVRCFEDNERKVYILKTDEFHKLAQELSENNDSTNSARRPQTDEDEEDEQAEEGDDDEDDDDDVEVIPINEEIYDCDADDDDE